MATYEDQVRRELEQKAAEQQYPIEDNVDASLSLRTQKKAYKKQFGSTLSGKPAVFKSKKSGGLSTAKRFKITNNNRKA